MVYRVTIQIKSDKIGIWISNMKKRIISVLIAISAVMAVLGCGSPTEVESTRSKLIEWRTGVWLSDGGTYTIYTPKHYFVLSVTGDTSNANLYYGCSQVSYHEKGMTRYQVQRLRKFPGGNLTMYSENTLTDGNTETSYSPDTGLFDPEKCVIQDGVIYDAVIEITDDYILLATCNGDREKIYNNGTSVYLPAGGGEYYSYRVEEF
jgi:hypothetical protein